MWNKTIDQLPELGKPCLVVYNYTVQNCTYLLYNTETTMIWESAIDEDVFVNIYDVTHWMYLPKFIS